MAMNAYATHVVSYLLAQSWQIAILAAIVGLISFTLRNRSAHLRYLLWLIVLAKCLVPPFLTVPLAVLPERVSSAPVTEVALPEEDSAREIPILVGEDSKPHKPALAVPSTRELVAFVWIAGAFLFLFWVGGRAVRYTSWLRQRRRALPPPLQESIRELSLGFKFKKWPKIWLLEDINQPFVWGLLRGSVYLPADFVGLSGSDRQRSILAHELSHVARFDAGVNLLQVMAQAVYWFHPLVWWANRKIRQEREKCCDETAVAQLNTPPEHYTGAIVDALAVERRSAHPIPSLAIVGSVKDIEERIKTMLKPGKTFRTRPSLVATTVALLMALVTIPTALVLTARGQTQSTTQSAAKPAANAEKPEQRRYTARTFNSDMAFDVLVQETGSDARGSIGHTPSTAPVQIPACMLWEVQPAGPVENWDLLIREMSQSSVPGLKLERATDPDLRRLAGLTGLQFLDLTGAPVTDTGLAHLKGLTRLWGLELRDTQIAGPGLQHLTGLTGLNWLDLSWTPVTDAGLQYLKELRGLRRLNLDGTKIADSGLEFLRGLPELNNLHLAGTQVTDAGLAHLRSLTSLTNLDLPGTEITDTGLQYLKELRGLRRLNLDGTKITGSGLEFLRGMPELSNLHLAGTQVTDAGLAHLRGLTNLTHLHFPVTQITDAGLEHLKTLTGLQQVNLSITKITDSGLASLAELTELQRLWLDQTQITDAGLAHLKGLTKLWELGFSGTQITDTGLEHLKGLTGLQKLWMANTQITNAGLAHLRGLTGLQGLDVGGTKITDAGLEHLKDLTELRTFRVYETRITDAGMVHLRGLTAVWLLNLSNTGITDAGLAYLEGLVKLKNLRLDKTQITDAGLEHLKGLTGLEDLSLVSTRITDSGLVHLKPLTGLRRLYLSGTQVTDAGVQQLQQSLPKLTIRKE
jgi:beta-lactamase regulating signal transducer with metallopeptidase domain/Leucine-rich repeat (LRR) protein